MRFTMGYNLKAIENFAITGHKLDDDFITAMAQVKKATFLAICLLAEWTRK